MRSSTKSRRKNKKSRSSSKEKKRIKEYKSRKSVRRKIKPLSFQKEREIDLVSETAVITPIDLLELKMQKIQKMIQTKMIAINFEKILIDENCDCIFFFDRRMDDPININGFYFLCFEAFYYFQVFGQVFIDYQLQNIRNIFLLKKIVNRKIIPSLICDSPQSVDIEMILDIYLKLRMRKDRLIICTIVQKIKETSVENLSLNFIDLFLGFYVDKYFQYNFC
jgi:hypothetical protein